MVTIPNEYRGLKFLASTLPPSNAVAVTPSDTVDLAHTASALYIGTSGNVKVNMEGSGSAILFKSVPVGILPGRFTRVLTTSNAATDIVALW